MGKMPSINARNAHSRYTFHASWKYSSSKSGCPCVSHLVCHDIKDGGHNAVAEEAAITECNQVCQKIVAFGINIWVLLFP